MAATPLVGRAWSLDTARRRGAGLGRAEAAAERRVDEVFPPPQPLTTAPSATIAAAAARRAVTCEQLARRNRHTFTSRRSGRSVKVRPGITTRCLSRT